MPTCTPRWRNGVHCTVFDSISSDESRAPGRSLAGPPLSRLPQVPEVREQPRSVGPRGEFRVLVGGQAGGNEVVRPPGVVDGRYRAVAGAGKRAGAVDDLPQDGLEVEAGADAQGG